MEGGKHTTVVALSHREGLQRAKAHSKLDLPFFLPTPCSSVIALQLGEGWARRWLIIHRRECEECVEQDRALDDEPPCCDSTGPHG